MSQKRIGLVVTGRGEETAIPLLIHRILHGTLKAYNIQCGRLIRKQETQLLHHTQTVLENTIQRLATDHDAVLILTDLDDDCPAELGPIYQARVREAYNDPDTPIFIVFAYRELETWFIHDAKNLFNVEPLPTPEDRRDAKGWIKTHNPAYREVGGSATLCARLDIEHVNTASDSFNVFVRRLTHIATHLSHTHRTRPLDNLITLGPS